MFRLEKLCILLVCLLQATEKGSYGQMKPSNAVAAVGGQAIFNCSGSSFLPNWFMSKDGTATNQLPIAGSCNVNINLQNHYKTEQIGGATYCNLVVFDVTMEQAGAYWCTDASNSYALLTVIDNSPVTSYNDTLGAVVESEKVIITCTLHHNGSLAPAPTLQPYFYWTNIVGQNVSSSYYSTTENTAVSQITVTAGRQNISGYTCHVYLKLNAAIDPNYATNTPTVSNCVTNTPINVMYFLGNISIISSVSAEYNCVYKQESLTCTADANPPAKYEWLDLNNNTVTSGSVKSITSGGRYQCTAYNDIRNQRHNETKTATETNCSWKTSTTSSESTSTLSVTSGSTLNNIVAIAMGVLFGISLAVNLTILIIWLCNYFRANKGKNNVPEPEMRYEEIRGPAEANIQPANYEELRLTPPIIC